MTENQRSALFVMIQSVVTAVLLFVQTIFTGCVTAGGDVNQQNDFHFTVPNLEVSFMEQSKKGYPVLFHCDDLPKFKQSYDDVVRTDDFKKVMEDNRNSDLSQDTGSTGGVYDYEDGKIPDDDKVSNLVLSLRSGRLDKADIQKLREQYEQNAKDEAAQNDADALKEADLALQRARQQHLDTVTGFDPSAVQA